MLGHLEQFYNRWLREQSRKEDSILSMPLQSQQELLLVLETIQKFVKLSNTTRVRLVIQHGKIDMFVDDSKEMST